jgi:imidazolonepropionase-like amidohydrolase
MSSKPHASIVVALASIVIAVPSHAQSSPPTPSDRFTLIRCGSLLDRPGQPARGNSTIVVKNDRIDRVIDGWSGPSINVDAKRLREIDLKQSFVLPGLIDCHVHVTFESSPDQRVRGVEESDAHNTVRGVTYCRKTVEAGFTTVRDVGAYGDSIFALRDAISRGDIVGPRILAAGKSVSITGGHADPTNGFRSDLWSVPTPIQGVADGPDECMKAVRNQIKRGADCIKLTATGGVLSQSTAGLRQHFTSDELKAIVTAAHAMGRKVAAHAHGTDGIKAALKAGCDSIEHATFQDEETIDLFTQTGAWYVPTLLAGATVLANAEIPGYYPPMVSRKAKEAGPVMIETFRKAHKAGVKIAFGTDSGVSTHGQNAKEFALMMQGGMSASDTIVCATMNAAKCLGIETEVGSLEPGKFADVVAVAKDPTKDASELERITFVMKSGEVIKSAPFIP